MKPKDSQKLWRQLLKSPWVVFGAIFCFFFIISWSRLDPDFGWHLMSGRYFIAHGIPKTDIFTYTASNFPWINHEWLGDIFLSRIYDLGGYGLVSFFYAVLWTIALWLMRRRQALWVMLLATLAMASFAGVRTVVWSVLGLAVLIRLLHARDTRYRLLIPSIFLLWANLHGSFVIGFVYGGLVAWKEWSWRLWALGGISVAVTFINPYGFALYVEIIRTMSDAQLHQQVAEWSPITVPIQVWPYQFLWLATLLFSAKKQWQHYLRFDVLLFFMSLFSTRMWPLFVIVSLESLQARMAIARKKYTIPNTAENRRLVAWYVRGGLAFVVVILLGTVLSLPVNRQHEYPQRAVAYLKSQPCTGNIFNTYGYGGYLIWKLPGQKVYIDGRMPSWWDKARHDKYMNIYLDVLDNTPVRRQEFLTYNIRCALLKTTDVKLMTALKEEHWHVAVTDPESQLLIYR